MPAGDEVLEGFLQKTDGSGTKWRRRYMRANTSSGYLQWFAEDPSMSPGEKELGACNLSGGSITLRPPPPAGAMGTAGFDHTLKVITADRVSYIPARASAFATVVKARWRRNANPSREARCSR